MQSEALGVFASLCSVLLTAAREASIVDAVGHRFPHVVGTPVYRDILIMEGDKIGDSYSAMPL